MSDAINPNIPGIPDDTNLGTNNIVTPNPDYSGKQGAHVPQPYIMAGQYPLDSKIHFQNKGNLMLFIDSENGIFKFHEGLIIYIVEEKSFYVYSIVDKDSENLLLDNNITYPDGSEYDGYDYSNKTFNFIPFREYFKLKNPDFINTGNGVEIYSPSSEPGKEDTHTFKSFKSVNGNLDIAHNIDETLVLLNAKSIKDLSKLYVVDPNLESNRVFNVFKYWSDLKLHLIGQGTNINPDIENAYIVFRGEINSSENLNLNRCSFHFEDSIFEYNGNDDYVLDNYEFAKYFIDNIIEDSQNEGAIIKVSSINLYGKGTITRSNAGGVVRAYGIYDYIGGDLEGTQHILRGIYYKIINYGDITLKQMPISIYSSRCEKALNGNGFNESYLDSMLRPIYIINEKEDLPILKLEKRNFDHPIFENRNKLTIDTINSTGIHVKDSFFKNTCGSYLIFKLKTRLVPYSDVFTNTETGLTDYTPLSGLDFIIIDSNTTDSMFSSELGSHLIFPDKIIPTGGFDNFIKINLNSNDRVLIDFDRLYFNAVKLNSFMNINPLVNDLSVIVDININDFLFNTENKSHFISYHDKSIFYDMDNLLHVKVNNGNTDLFLSGNYLNYLDLRFLAFQNYIISSVLSMFDDKEEMRQLIQNAIYYNNQKILKIK